MKMLRYLFRHSGSSPAVDAPDSAQTFSYHRKSGMAAYICALLLAAVVELTVMHYFVAKWSVIAAWILTISSVWLAMTIVAQLRTIGWRPHFVDQGNLVLRNGMYQLASIPLQKIERVERTSKAPETAPGDDSPLPVSHNVVIYLSEPCHATLLYGQTRPFRKALAFVDEPANFCKAFAVD